MKKNLIKKLKQITAFSLFFVMLALSACSKETTDKEKESAKAEEDTSKKNNVNANNSKPSKTETLSYNLSIDTDTSVLDESYDISDILYGIFFEDINYAIDGGIYAEMIRNRSFEFGKLATEGAKNGWGAGDNVNFEVVDGSSDGSSLNANNPHYAVIENTGAEFSGIRNRGILNGISLVEGKEYRLSVFVKGLDGYTGPVKVVLCDQVKTDTIYGEATIDNVTGEWWKYTVSIMSNTTVSSSVRCHIQIGQGKVALDMVSLFPVDTYKNRENGLRADVVEYLAALQPKFIRFPGGCVVEGKTYESQYSWKDSIGNGMEMVINGETTVGDVAVRPQGIDI